MLDQDREGSHPPAEQAQAQGTDGTAQEGAIEGNGGQPTGGDGPPATAPTKHGAGEKKGHEGRQGG